ncbi:hypothetical protein [Bradyrhizobium sp. USDA 4506]
MACGQDARDHRVSLTLREQAFEFERRDRSIVRASPITIARCATPRAALCADCDQRSSSVQVLSRCFAGVTSAAAAAVEIPAAIAISVVATNLFRMCTIIVSNCRCRIVRNAE